MMNIEMAQTNRTAIRWKAFPGVLLLGLVALIAAAGCSTDPQPSPPEPAVDGDRLMREMSDALAGASAIRFSTQETLEPLESSPSQELLRFSRTVTIRRPDAMYFELHGSGETPIEVEASYDGAVVSLRDKAHGVWAQTVVPGTLDEMLDDVARRYSLPVPIGDIIYSVPYEAFIGPTSEGGLVGIESIDGVECAHLTYTDEYVSVAVWIPITGQPLPLRVELVYKQAPGEPKARVDFTNWDLEAQVAAGIFAFEPAEGTMEIAVEDFVARLLADAGASTSVPVDEPAPNGPVSQ